MKFSANKKQELYRQILKDRYKKDLFSFSQQICGYTDVNWNAHGSIIETLEHPHNRKLIVTPRGTFKSSLCVVSYSLWLLTNNPNLRILITSELYTNSKNFIREIKAHIESEKFQSIYGSWRGPVWHESEIIVKARTKNYKEASITAAGVGTIKVGQHYDVIIMDDVNSNQNSDTIEKAKKVVDYYRYILSILEPDGIMAVIGTRYSEADLIGHILSNELEIKDVDKEIHNHNIRILNEYATA
jgi:hypothetical protein